MDGITTGYNVASQMDMGSSTCNDRAFVPQVRLEVIPQIGQEFDSLDDAHRFYNEYAREARFSIRAWTTKKNNNNEITRREFVCFKQGIRQVENSNYVPKRKRCHGCGLIGQSHDKKNCLALNNVNDTTL